ncbi:ABC transporter ATP-binding protein [Thermovenabulum gondwanense]|uniref:Putative ABC transporter ATP-binding protein n=1 Tax=Thermovenabulum gondwanense TaxID=520767 RepID=A0A162M826_9FIRM|nr:ABC transporter ATP-binding protein [Thermovenabulum gondwanense]KYO64499.1 putative ABC transporter ATP-binding protein [Thermovenabulum gondwanense]
MSIKVCNLKKRYMIGKNEIFALNNVSFEINKGSFAVILGPSGSGKSTLLNILGGIDKADEGKIIIDDEEITKYSDEKLTEYRRNYVGFIFQFYNLVNTLNVYENVCSTAVLSKNSLDVEEILDVIGLKAHKRKFPYELSGGEQQRVAIARAIVKNPKMILCDEPTGALDYENAKNILSILRNINQKYNTTVFLVTHNVAISKMADVIIRLRSGEIIDYILNEAPLKAEEVEW